MTHSEAVKAKEDRSPVICTADWHCDSEYERIVDFTYKERDGKMIKHACTIFNCDIRHGNYCCYYCKVRDKCHNPCINTPDKCGLHVEEKERKAK